VPLTNSLDVAQGGLVAPTYEQNFAPKLALRELAHYVDGVCFAECKIENYDFWHRLRDPIQHLRRFGERVRLVAIAHKKKRYGRSHLRIVIKDVDDMCHVVSAGS
jgi:hypothetical protein